MKRNKIIALLIAAAALCGGFRYESRPKMTAIAEDTQVEDTISGKHEHLEYTIYTNDNFAAITKFDNTVNEVTIPAEIEGYTVTTISAHAFEDCTKLQNIILPEGIITIDELAFHNAPALKAIELPDSLITIGASAFEGCFSLGEIIFSDNLTNIGKAAFKDCPSLQSASIKGNMTCLPSQLFRNCTALTDVHIAINIVDLNNYQYFETDQPACSFYNCAVKDVYYEGTENMWNAIKNKGETRYNPSILNATVHYGATLPPMRSSLYNADLNDDGVVNASDATIVLQYAAYVGTHGVISVDDYMQLKRDHQ